MTFQKRASLLVIRRGGTSGARTLMSGTRRLTSTVMVIVGYCPTSPGGTRASGLPVDIGFDRPMSGVMADGKPDGQRIDHEAEIGISAFELEREGVLRTPLDRQVEGHAGDRSSEMVRRDQVLALVTILPGVAVLPTVLPRVTVFPRVTILSRVSVAVVA